MRLLDTPKITVITVVFNGRQLIEATILSVVGQSYPNLEYIVIDGGSTDGTCDVIKKYEAHIDYWCSEKDRGIYDAMNKGLAKATGRWVNFMNAGDTFYESNTLKELFLSQKRTATVIYGSVEIAYPDWMRTEEGGSPDRLWQGMQFSHQACFVDTSYHQAHPFNIHNSIAADLAFFYQAYQSEVVFFKSDRIISRVITGGVSELNRVKTILASRDAVCGGRLRPLISLYFYLQVVDSLIRSIAKRFLPKRIVKWIILSK